MGMFDFLGDLFGGDSGDSQTVVQNDIRKLPDYAESEGARSILFDKLKEWGSQPGYGAVAPNWNDIWESSRQKLSRYFMGGPEGPGLNAQVKSRAAARGMSENPAGDTMLQRSGFQHGNMLADLAIKQAMEEANFGERGRTNWLGSIQNLAGLKPSFSSFGSTTTREYAPPNPVSQGVGGLMENFAGTGSTGFDPIDSLLDMFGMGGGDSGIGDVMPTGDEDDEGFDWLSAIMGGGRMFAGDYAGGGAQLASAFA